MMLIFRTLCLCLALAASRTAASHHENHLDHGEAVHDRCEGIEFDAITISENLVPHFFKGDHLWKGFHGKAELTNGTYDEIDDHHNLGHIDAAIRMHFEGRPDDHDHIFIFVGNLVFKYENHKLEEGYPKKIQEVFPGIPDELDAAVECPKGDCTTNSVLFFKGDHVYHFDIENQKVEEKEWDHLENCTSAFRWLEHYYCFHGHKFTKFEPVSGNVTGKYPKDARNYFMRCAKFAHDSDHTERETCSRVHLDAITSDNAGNVYAFRGHHFLEQDAGSDKWSASRVEDTWKELHSDVDAVFSYKDHLYMIKDEEVFVYSVNGEKHTLLEGYPKSVYDELGIKGHVDAAFVCKDNHIVHVIQGKKMHDIDMNASPRAVLKEYELPFHDIDAGMCGSDGVKIMDGPYYYHYESPTIMAASRMLPEKHKIAAELFGCDH